MHAAPSTYFTIVYLIVTNEYGKMRKLQNFLYKFYIPLLPPLF